MEEKNKFDYMSFHFEVKDPSKPNGMQRLSYDIVGGGIAQVINALDTLSKHTDCFKFWWSEAPEAQMMQTEQDNKTEA